MADVYLEMRFGYHNIALDNVLNPQQRCCNQPDNCLGTPLSIKIITLVSDIGPC